MIRPGKDSPFGCNNPLKEEYRPPGDNQRIISKAITRNRTGKQPEIPSINPGKGQDQGEVHGEECNKGSRGKYFTRRRQTVNMSEYLQAFSKVFK